MANARKLQGEIDRTFKKIQEGIAEYDSIYEKIATATSPAQKEKYEGDLKSQIKKLQRLREQIKAWIASSDLKNKAPLLEQRKKIEGHMEKYKAFEREAKTKAYSKEGLQSQREKAKRDDGRGEITRWLQKSIDELKVQIDGLETASADSKKKKGPQNEVAHAQLERHNFHLNALEKILRLWENESLSKDEVEEVRDGVDYYLQSNQDPDFVEDETLYEPLGIDPSNVNLPSASSATEDSDESDDEVGSNATTDTNADESDDEEPVVAPAPTPVAKPAPTPAPAPTPTPAAKKTAPAPAPVVEEKPEPKEETPAPVKATPAKATPAKSTGAVKTFAAQTTPQPAVVHTPAPEEKPAVKAFSAVAAGAAAKTPAPEPAKPAVSKPVVEHAEKETLSVPTPTAHVAPPAAGKTAGVRAVPANTRTTPSPAPVVALANSTAALSASGTHPAPITPAPSAQPSAPSPAPIAGPTLPTPTAAASLPPSVMPLSASTSNLQQSPIALMLASLTSSYNNLPEPDYNARAVPYKPKTPIATPSYYPHTQSSLFENPALFEKFDVDALFFIFYYQQGTYQQYLAAKELKRQSWRYHKKYLTWFQRLEEPKEITADHEQGTYIYFDYETGWCQRKKTEFTFEYRYLEDKDLM